MQAILNALTTGNSKTSSGRKFYAELEMEPDFLKVELAGSGAIPFPVSPKSIVSLLKRATPAKFGMCDQTLLDTDVRHTHEIAPDQLTVTPNTKKFSTMLGSIRKKLGLPDNVTLTAHLHNMLIYDKGQFSKASQDTEKLEDKGLRDKEDWRIDVTLSCKCEYCRETTRFLKSNNTQNTRALIEQHRGHIEEVLKGFLLPLEVRTIKTKRPYQLVIRKTDRLYAEAKQRFDSLTQFNTTLCTL